MAVQIRHRSLFREVTITAKHLENAKKKADDLGKLNNSIRAGEGNFIGFLGEEIVKEYLKIGDSNTYQFDLIFNNKKLEVKTKERTVMPQPDYNATISNYNSNQQCDYYVFNSVLKDHSKGWICGIMKKTIFYEKAKFNKKGDMETSIFKFRSNCYNLPLGELDDINSICGALDLLL